MRLETMLDQIEADKGFTYQSEANGWRLSIDKQLSIWLKEQVAGVRLWIPLSKLDEENSLNHLLLVMRANLFGQGTGRGLISLDQSTNEFQYSIDHPWEANYDKCLDLIEEICNFAEYWQQALALEGTEG